MNLEQFRTYCLTKKGAEETYPFGEHAMWMKVGGKAFAWTFVQDFKMEGEMRPPFYFINMKCDPEQAVIWREQFEEIEAGWHQSKKHWNTVFITGNLSDETFSELIDHAYEVVKKGLTKKQRAELDAS